MKRLVLFDIDGTLVSTHGAGSRAVRSALLEVYGETGPIDSYDFHGRTDPQIVRELLRMAGLSDDAINDRIDGLWERFDFGAYGSDHERRDRLPEVARRRAREQTGLEFNGLDIVIIGDTPFDVTCGQSLGVWTVAVATGRHTPAELRDAGADVVFEDLSDTAAVVDAIVRGGTTP
jgi:phosphoglycolate phosphatase-like HAD superfamily hydrolase